MRFFKCVQPLIPKKMSLVRKLFQNQTISNKSVKTIMSSYVHNSAELTFQKSSLSSFTSLSMLYLVSAWSFFCIWWAWYLSLLALLGYRSLSFLSVTLSAFWVSACAPTKLPLSWVHSTIFPYGVQCVHASLCVHVCTCMCGHACVYMKLCVRTHFKESNFISRCFLSNFLEAGSHFIAK